MKLKKIAKKTIAIWSVLLLLLSLNISINVFAELNNYNADNHGVAYDDFGNDNSVDLEKCVVDGPNSSIILDDDPLSSLYNHDVTPSNVKGWYKDDTYIAPGSGGEFAQLLSLLISPNLLEGEEFDSLEPIDDKDSEYLETDSLVHLSLGIVYYPLHMFEIKISEDVSRVDDFTVEWWSGPYDEDANLDTVTMYLWSYGDYIPRWNYIGERDYNTNIADDAISSTEKAETFADEDGSVHILIVGTPVSGMDPLEPGTLSSDYVEVQLTTKVGYVTNGYAVSDIIDPDTFYGWESVIWESTKPSTNSYVKLQILKSNGDPITELDGNSNGFTTSPIDLSSLGTSYSEIRLKATLHSEKFDVTPRLYSWAILWQTTNGFKDDFNYEYRIEEAQGLKIEGGTVKISEFYTEWPIFGKTPTNTRSYVGADVEYEGNRTYWQTPINENIGGWFRSPVMSEGRVYIGADDFTIYAFDLPLDTTDDETAYSPADQSNARYTVETSVAADEGYVIFGTGELNSLDNKIYALDSTNLKNELWNYSVDNNKTICFSRSTFFRKNWKRSLCFICSSKNARSLFFSWLVIN